MAGILDNPHTMRRVVKSYEREGLPTGRAIQEAKLWRERMEVRRRQLMAEPKVEPHALGPTARREIEQ